MKLKLLNKIKNTSIKDIFSVASVFSSVTGSLFMGNGGNVSANSEHADWEGEKEDILESANWLCSKIVVSDPETLMNEATFFGDWEFRYQMLRTAEIAGGTKKEKGLRHYKISDMFLVGEATALAMRTNIKR